VIEFRINLLRDQVANAAQRRRRYMAMMTYLGVTGLLLVGAVGLASSRMVEASALRAQSQRVENVYARDHEGQGGLLAGAARLNQRIQKLVMSLQAVDQKLAKDPRPARLVRNLMVSLPAGVSLRTLRVAQEDKSVAIELVLAGGYEGQVSATDLLGLWQKDEQLMADLAEVNLQGSQIENVGGSSGQVWRFSGRLREGT
jgi:Tfp pilus assembly protein PilN